MRVSPAEVADFLGVEARSVRRWWANYRRRGVRGLTARPASGRPPKLSHTRAKTVERWLSQSPTEWGYLTELWTARRLAELIRGAWAIDFHPRYLCEWLRGRGYSPQKPQRVPRERDEQVIARWVKTDWARILKKIASGGAA
jgi:transposase